jgi:hypothetical protein
LLPILVFHQFGKDKPPISMVCFHPFKIFLKSPKGMPLAQNPVLMNRTSEAYHELHKNQNAIVNKRINGIDVGTRG